MSEIWWLSFGDDTRPPPNALGVTVIPDAEDFQDAVDKAWDRKANPGGEVRGVQIAHVPDDMPVNRLMGPDEALKFGERVTPGGANHMCDHCRESLNTERRN